MSAHTPGPWVVSQDCPYDIKHEETGREIATTNPDCLFDTVQTDEEAMANARLIATSAELLESLRDLVAQVDENSWIKSEIAAARAAIDKAEGRDA